MSRIEIITLNAELSDVPDERYFENGDIVLRFGQAEVMRWTAPLPYFRYDDDRLRFLEEFVADKLRELFAAAGMEKAA